MKSSNLDISFIIPAFNEEKEIARTLNAIYSSTKSLDVEVIVVDNLSTDQTASICQEYDALVVSSDAPTISGVRNEGARLARGTFLAFIDADVSLDPEWGEVFAKIVKDDPSFEKKVFGSKCKTPYFDYISKGWFSRIRSPSSGYINSGHLIVSKNLFDEIGQFRTDFATSEDVDLCQRAKAQGFEISEINQLTTYHYGFPRNLIDFVKRETWHGHQDVSSLEDLKDSKTALLSLVTIITFITTVAISILTNNYHLGIASIIFLFTISLVFYCFKTTISKEAIIFWPIASAYLLGRFASILMKLRHKKIRSSRSA